MHEIKQQDQRPVFRGIKGGIRFVSLYTDATNEHRPGHSIRMYWTNLWQPTAPIQQKIFGKTSIEVCSSHLYASFGTFYAKIGQFFEAEWAFELCPKIDNQLSSKENVVDLEILLNV